MPGMWKILQIEDWFETTSGGSFENQEISL
jgi:hypothetical protein